MKKDRLFETIHNEVIRVLRFSKKNLDSGKWEHENHTKNYYFNFIMKKYRDNEFPEFDNISSFVKILEIKINNIFIWIDENYKNEGYMKNYKKEYYQNITNADNKHKPQKEHLKKVHKDKADKSYKLVKNAYSKCIEQGIKPTIKNCVEICKLNKNTVNKYLKIIKSKL